MYTYALFGYGGKGDNQQNHAIIFYWTTIYSFMYGMTLSAMVVT
jgi:hypothetical protein